MVLRRFVLKDALAKDFPGCTSILADSGQVSSVFPVACKVRLGHLLEADSASA